MPPKREEVKGPVERFHERIATRDTGWFFAQIADRVADRRTTMGLSQRDLAERCGTTQSAIARMEGGGARPNLETLEKLATAVGAELVVGVGEHLSENRAIAKLVREGRAVVRNAS